MTGQTKMSFRGGKREGAGRKEIGKSKLVRLNLPDQDWEWLEKKVGEAAASLSKVSLSELIRNLIKNERKREFEG